MILYCGPGDFEINRQRVSSLSLNYKCININYLCTSDFESPFYYFFFSRAKHNGAFGGVFHGGDTFLTKQLPVASLRTISGPKRHDSNCYVDPDPLNVHI
jgi:hypothetical protein